MFFGVGIKYLYVNLVMVVIDFYGFDMFFRWDIYFYSGFGFVDVFSLVGLFGD